MQVTASEFFDDFAVDFEVCDGLVDEENLAAALFASHVYHLTGFSIAPSF